MPKDLPPEVLEEIATGVANVRALFLAYVDSGFTEEQAVHLVGCQLSSIEASPKPRPSKSPRR